MRIGFTGTRLGMTIAQKRSLQQYLHTLAGLYNSAGVSEYRFLHGNCVGADEEAARIAKAEGFTLQSHPGDNPFWQSKTLESDSTRPVRPNLERNKTIVHSSNVMFACPKEETEPDPGRGQGTWSTIRYARKQPGLKIHIIWPDGSVT